ncbi:MAG: septum site-determining protein MinC [Oceanospirillum sp.]|nr:septum site-determining protein MinC [Oceanospirillum sp.]
MQSQNSEQQAAFQFKGGNLTVTSLELNSADCSSIERELQQQTRRAPAFFHQTPVILAFDRLEQDSVALEMIVDVCKRNGLIPIAVRCSQDTIKKSAWALGLGWFPPQADRRLKEVAREKGCPNRKPTRIVRGTVRSGQQVYADCADLVVIGSVNEGAEVIADGNIQVWGSLRGRAIAGAQGDLEARVLCQQIRAELVSIAGTFQTFDAYTWPEDSELPVEVRLENEALVIS